MFLLQIQSLYDWGTSPNMSDLVYEMKIITLSYPVPGIVPYLVVVFLQLWDQDSPLKMVERKHAENSGP